MTCDCWKIVKVEEEDDVLYFETQTSLVKEFNICVCDRDRHRKLVLRIREYGARGFPTGVSGPRFLLTD